MKYLKNDTYPEKSLNRFFPQTTDFKVAARSFKIQGHFRDFRN